MAGSRADQKMDSVPPAHNHSSLAKHSVLIVSKVLLKLYIDVIHESEGCGVDEEAGAQAAEVVEVLDGVHGEPGEGLYVRVAVVQAVDVLVHRRYVDKPGITNIFSRCTDIEQIIIYIYLCAK